MGSGGVFRETHNQTSARQEVQIACQSRRIAGVLKLADHLVVGQDLPGILSAELKQPFQQRRLVHPLHRENVTLDIGLDQPLRNVRTPATLLPHERRSPG